MKKFGRRMVQPRPLPRRYASTLCSGAAGLLVDAERGGQHHVLDGPGAAGLEERDHDVGGRGVERARDHEHVVHALERRREGLGPVEVEAGAAAADAVVAAAAGVAGRAAGRRAGGAQVVDDGAAELAAGAEDEDRIAHRASIGR